MRIPRYWAKGSAASGMPVTHPATGEAMEAFSCWGWSDVSVDEAQQRGRQRAAALAEMIRRGTRPDRYLYGDRPMREQILDQWNREDATTFAAVTLNGYGCQVLNTASVMFVDVDLPEVPAMSAFVGRLKRLLGNRGPSPRQQQASDALARVQEMIRADPRCGVRVYRTRGGLRYLLTHAHADPGAETTLRAMEVLGADPLYVRLCQVQECFRARLTPKPWRCGTQALRVRYPWQDPKAERAARDWIDAYSRKAERYATCLLIEQFGSTEMDEEIARVVEFHDAITKARSGLELA
ncbi:MAG: hypothetical protein JXB62_11900 [Pirellulales bacterium]|nr:hypothetical protein [Pirellulales bacterium]